MGWTIDYLKRGVVLTLPLDNKPEFPDFCSVGVCITDDPSSVHACDWVNLGFTRLLVVLEDARKLKQKKLCFSGVLKFYDFNIPERHPE